MLFKIIMVVQVLAALVIIGLVLMQHGKGADMGAAFGAGASGSLFGATGSSNFLSRSTAGAAVVFFVATLVMAYMGYSPGQKSSVVDQLETMQVAPATQPSKAESAPSGMAAVPGVPAGKSEKDKSGK